MPFKIIQTSNEQQNQQELCICPSTWEKHGLLHWPNKNIKKLCKMEDSTPQPNWTKINCIVKRNNIMSYEIANKQLMELFDCSTTEQKATEPLPAPSSHLIGPTKKLENFNIIAQQAVNLDAATVSNPPEQIQIKEPLNCDAATVSNPPEQIQIKKPLNRDAATLSNPPKQIQIQEPLYAVAVNKPISIVTVKNETTSVPVVASPSDLERITNNQVEIHKNQEAILNDLTLLKDNYKNVLENQQRILTAIAHISLKFDTFITGKYEPQVTKLNDTMKKTSDDNRFCLKPIRNIEELSNLEAILNDGKMKEDYKIKYSIVCQPGKAENCAYQLVDVFFTREFLTKCSWSGSARGEGTKVCLKQYKNVLQMFFELIYECDHTYTIAGNEKFFKSILKNATKRKNSKLQRSSTCRNSHKRQKLSENPVNNNESSEEGTSNEAQNLVNKANEENRENKKEKTSQEENAQISESVAIEDIR